MSMRSSSTCCKSNGGKSANTSSSCASAVMVPEKRSSAGCSGKSLSARSMRDSSPPSAEPATMGGWLRLVLAVTPRSSGTSLWSMGDSPPSST
uniref:Uncharacterized protein n=1 Tax=Triticum urartu TaxID=4572 RepID=A0A8R7QNZ6_TRIUA